MNPGATVRSADRRNQSR